MWGGRIMNMNIHLSVRLWNDHVHYYNHIFLVCLFRPSLSYSVELLLYPLLWKSYPPSLPLRSLQIKRICTWSSPPKPSLIKPNTKKGHTNSLSSSIESIHLTSESKQGMSIQPHTHAYYGVYQRVSLFPCTHTHIHIYTYVCQANQFSASI